MKEKSSVNFEELTNHMNEMKDCASEVGQELGSIGNIVNKLGEVGIMSGKVKDTLGVISNVVKKSSNSIVHTLNDYNKKINQVYLSTENIEQQFVHTIEAYLAQISNNPNLTEQHNCFDQMVWQDGHAVAKKPLIYLYPKEETNVSVKLLSEDKLTVTYPKYNNGWNVLAKPNGDLVDTHTNRNLYGLYWEGLNTTLDGMKDYGFVVKGTNTIPFLEEKLALLGLNEREANEFIIYWLPKLEKNNYNYIRFATNDEVNANMPLEILPKPDTLIRISMEYKKLENMIDIKEQKIFTPNRNGFVAVEWGGTDLD